MSHEVPILPPSESDTSGNGNGDATIPMPEFIFVKHMPKEIDRLRTEVNGASFGFKVNKTKGAKKCSNADDDGGNDTINVQDLLQPKKKRKTTAKKAPKAKAKSQAEPEEAQQIFADVDVGGSGTRKRWWIDDVLSCLIHAAGLGGGWATCACLWSNWSNAILT